VENNGIYTDKTIEQYTLPTRLQVMTWQLTHWLQNN